MNATVMAGNKKNGPHQRDAGRFQLVRREGLEPSTT